MSIPTEKKIKLRINEAIEGFWKHKDEGSMVDGESMDGFALMIKRILMKIGIKEKEIITGAKAKLPGYFRLQKNWDMIVVKKDQEGSLRLLAVIEFKSMFGSVGNNLNNRVEEALGSGYDLSKSIEHKFLVTQLHF